MSEYDKVLEEYKRARTVWSDIAYAEDVIATQKETIEAHLAMAQQVEEAMRENEVELRALKAQGLKRPEEYQQELFDLRERGE